MCAFMCICVLLYYTYLIILTIYYIELERQRRSVVVICHLAVLRYVCGGSKNYDLSCYC